MSLPEKDAKETAAKVLIVDDLPANQIVLQKTLQMVGFEAFLAANGSEALAQAAERAPDLIFLDIMMPEMDGYEVCRRLKENPGTRDIPIIFISARKDVEDIVRGLQVGGLDYITKPFQREEIIARARTHVQLYRLSRQREQLLGELAAKNAKLAELVELKNRFIGFATHDLANPLNVLRGVADLLAMGRANLSEAEIGEIVGLIQDAGEKMHRLIMDLLSVTHLESGEFRITPAPADLGRLVAERVRFNQIIARNKQIRIEEALDRVAELPCDSGRIAQVVDNLISNAIKYSPSGSVVRVSLKQNGAEATVCVRDQGKGIPDAEQGRLFQPFQKLSTRPTGGESSTGLGLVICKKIIDAHRGRIYVESRPGEGSAFFFSLPIADSGQDR